MGRNGKGSNYVFVGGTLTNTSTGAIYVQGAGGYLTAGTLINQGFIGVYGYYTEGGAGFQVAGNATNSGMITVGDTGDSTGQIGANGTFTNNRGALIQLFGDEGVLSAGTLVNNGTINLVGATSYIYATDGFDNSGTLSLQSNETVETASLTNSGSIAFENNSYLQDSGDVINSGTISTSGQYSNTLNITGRLTNNAGGTFSLGVSGDIATVGYVTNAGTINLGSGTMLTVTGGSHATATALPGFLNNGVVNIGQGATLLSAASFTQITGQTTVDGTLQVAGRSLINLAGGSLYGNGGTVEGNVTSNASINIGDTPTTLGALTFMGNYSQGANGSLTFDIAGNAPGQYDQLNVSGHAQLNGLMTVDLLNGYIPQLGNTFEVMTYGSESGNFSMVVGLPINNQEHFVLEYNSTNLTLDVQSGQISGPTIKGGNGTYFVSEPFISTAGDGSSSSTLAQNNPPGATTPEPASIVLFASGLAGIAGVLRRKREV